MPNSMDVLAPNYLGTIVENYGLDSFLKNRGLGVKEARPEDVSQKNKVEEGKNKLRTAKARQFGLTKETVGF